MSLREDPTDPGDFQPLLVQAIKKNYCVLTRLADRYNVEITSFFCT